MITTLRMLSSFNNITNVIIIHCCWLSYRVSELSGLIGSVNRMYPRGYTFHLNYYNATLHSLQEEHLRPCYHVIAVMTATQRHNFDLMDKSWFGSVWHVDTWEKQYSHHIVRASGMQATDIVEYEFLPAKLNTKPGRKKRKPHVSLPEPDPRSPNLRAHKCGKCDRYGHNSAGCRAPDINVMCRNNRAGARKEVQMSTHTCSVPYQFLYPPPFYQLQHALAVPVVAGESWARTRPPLKWGLTFPSLLAALS